MLRIPKGGSDSYQMTNKLEFYSILDTQIVFIVLHVHNNVYICIRLFISLRVFFFKK